MLKIRFCQRWLVRRQCMVTCPATTEQNDGDKSRKNGPGKISTLSVGQGETPGNLLTVIHKALKPSKKLNRKVFSKPSVSSRVHRTHTLRSRVASACSTCAPTIIWGWQIIPR